MVIPVPFHRHEVKLDIARIQFQLEYTFDEPWAVRWRLPIEQKSRTASIGSIHPDADEDDIEAMERNLQIHHRSRNLTGFGDMEMLLCWHKHDLGKDGAFFSVASGTTVPLGRTEGNPLTAAAAGEAHEHIQFGNGTFDPIVEFFYSRPIGEESIVSAFGQGRFPGSRNDEGFQGSKSFQCGIGAMKPVGHLGSGENSFGIAGLIYQDLSQATWDGVIDPNTGFSTLSGTLGISWKDEEFRNWSLTLLLPISFETAESSDGTYDVGPVLSLGIGF